MGAAASSFLVSDTVVQVIAPDGQTRMLVIQTVIRKLLRR